MSTGLVAPHGGTLVDRRLAPWEAEQWRERVLGGGGRVGKITLTNVQLADLELIAIGAYSPLTGFLGERDYRSVLSEMRLANGLVWSLPITLRLPADVERVSDVLALHDA